MFPRCEYIVQLHGRVDGLSDSETHQRPFSTARPVMGFARAQPILFTGLIVQ
jgi:hypothetical protein